MTDCRDSVLFFQVLISFSEDSRMMCFTKKLYFTLICPQEILASLGKFWQTPIRLFNVSTSAEGLSGSPTIASLFIQIATDSASCHCCTLCRHVSLNLFWKLTEVLYQLFEQAFVAVFHHFSLSSTFRDIRYIAMGCKLLDNVAHSGHRNIKKS